MEQEQQPDPQYMKGFNNGYFLAKHDPDLAAKLTAQSNDHSSYFKGFTGGKQEYEKEVREWMKGFSKGTPNRDDKAQQKER